MARRTTSIARVDSRRPRSFRDEVLERLDQLIAAIRNIGAETSVAVDFEECCRRLGISTRTGKRLVHDGRFPIPPLPWFGDGTGKKERRRFSTDDIDLYLREASTERSLTAADRYRYAFARSRALRSRG